MGRVILSAGHGGYENGAIDPGVQAAGLTEAREMIWLREATAQTLQQRGVSVLMVPDDLSLAQTIAWINSRGRADDLAIELHLEASTNLNLRGTTIFFLAENEIRRRQAEVLLRALLTRVPQLSSRGAQPDSATGLGNRSFCRQLKIPSLLAEVGFLSNAIDRGLLKSRGWEVAAGLADGLGQVLALLPPPATVYDTIAIRINGQPYPERGILVNGNAYIPIALADRLNASQIVQRQDVVKLNYQNVVYFKAVDLRPFNIAVGWDNATRSVLLRTILAIANSLAGELVGRGNTSEVQLSLYLKANNPLALGKYPDLARLYREEANTEGMNYDIAFCQMCVETNFLNFANSAQAASNNFGGLGSVAGDRNGAIFASARLGVRAQIQHLKAYANTEPLVNPVVDPRFSFVPRGVAPKLDDLTNRWTADANYGTKIASRLRSLYQSAGLL